MSLKICVIGIYAVLIIFMGLMGMRKTRSFSDFFLGGGNIGPWMTAFTYGTAYFSAVLFIGFAGKIGWGFGYSGLWIAIGNSLIGVLGVWWILGYRIKKMSLEYKVSTMAEFFEKRYESRFLKAFSAACIFIFFIPYSAAVFIGLSYLFKANFNINFTIALVFMGVFTAIYLVMGGYKSMTMVDVFFGIIMIVGVLILLFSTIRTGGGLEKLTTDLHAIKPELTAMVGPPGLWPLFCLVFLTSIAPMGMPQLVQKFYAIKDKRSIRIGMVASTFFALLVCGTAYFTGATARIFLSPTATPDAFADGKPIFDALMPVLLSTVIPSSLSILILLLILSASMSTLAALILISSSSVAKDIYAGFINPQVSDKKLTLLMRFCSAFFILLSVIFAYFRPATIVAILGISWGAIGAVFLGPFIWGLFWKKANRFGAIASSVLGLATCIGLYMTGSSSPEAGTIGMLVSLIINPVVSIIIPVQSVNTRKAATTAIFVLITVAVCCPATQAEEKTGIEFGFHHRTRFVDFENIIDTSDVTDDHNQFFRFRTQVWAQYVSKNIQARMQLTNEFRHYYDPDKKGSFDELFVDQLYVKINNLFDSPWFLHIGRQNMIRGNGFLFFDPSPLDGSRSIYNNAAILGYNRENSKFEIIAISNPAEDEYLPVIGDKERLLNEFDETIFGLCYTKKCPSKTQYEATYLYIIEESPDNSVYEKKFHLGDLRTIIPMGENSSLTVEAGYQTGEINSDIDVSAWAGFVTWKQGFETSMNPYFKLTGAAYSGDDPGTEDYENWSTPLGRWPLWSELYIYSYIREAGIGNWSNLWLAGTEFGVVPGESFKMKLSYYKLMAFEEPQGLDSMFGTGKNRGDLFIFRADYKLLPGLAGHAVYEYLLPGDFYTNDDPAHFLRFELTYKFSSFWDFS